MWAHPRSCGENQGYVTSIREAQGSSPLMRGKRHAVRARSDPRGLIPAHAGKTYGNGHYVASHRLIPAHAGKTPGHRGRSTPERAHPRSRKENGPLSPGVAVLVGSSQLMRGKLRFGSILPGDFGLIPAHAGKTCSQRCGCGRRRAHPRSRGENRAEKAHPAFQKGSSLLTQGKLDV